MKAISLKMDDDLLEEIDAKLQEHRYSTRTEFIRDAIREKLTELEKQRLLQQLDEVHGRSTGQTTDEELHAIREALAKELF
jgi:metal-responsive CopG/Arc/MetJ family transcriptional regulator